MEFKAMATRSASPRFGIRLVAIVATLAVFMGACGDDGDTTADRESPPTTPAAGDSDSTSPEPATVKVILTSESLGYLPYIVAVEQGYFDDEGITIDRLPDIPNSGTVMQTLASGEADIALVTGSAVIALSAAQSGGVHEIARMQVGAVLQLVLRNEVIDRLAEDGVTTSSPIEERVRALDGISIAGVAPGTGTDVLIRTTLAEYGLNADSDVTLLAADRDAAIAAIREGQTEGLLQSSPTSDILKAEGIADYWIKFQSGEIEQFDDLDWAVVAANSGFVEANGEVATRFVRAIWRALDFIHEHEDEAKEIALELSGLDAETFDLTWESISSTYPETPLPNQGAFERTYDLVKGSNPDLGDVQYSQIYPEEIIEAGRP